MKSKEVVLKLDGHFKLSKTTKRLMATIKDKTQRASFKNAMCGAELKAKLPRMAMMYDVPKPAGYVGI